MPPVTICWTQFGQPFCGQPIWMTAMMAAPIIVPSTVPRPPARLPPPMITAAMTSSSRPTATVGSPTESFENCSTPGHADQRADRVDDDLRPRDRHAAQPRRALVRADGEHVPAEARVAQHAATTSAEHEDEPDARRRATPRFAGRRAQQVVQPGERRLDAPLVGQPLGRAAHDQHRPQRDDEGHDAEAGDEQRR